jgi:hypothetical protein
MLLILTFCSVPESGVCVTIAIVSMLDPSYFTSWMYSFPLPSSIFLLLQPLFWSNLHEAIKKMHMILQTNIF